MFTMTAEQLGSRAGDVRRALRTGDEVKLTFRGRPYARVVDHEQIERERAELARLRRIIAEHGLTQDEQAGEVWAA